MVHVDQLITVVNMLFLDDKKEWILDHFWQFTSYWAMIDSDLTAVKSDSDWDDDYKNMVTTEKKRQTGIVHLMNPK